MKLKTLAFIGALALGLSSVTVAQTSTPPSRESPSDGRTGGAGPLSNNPSTDKIAKQRQMKRGHKAHTTQRSKRMKRDGS